jgi:hypothetical protein
MPWFDATVGVPFPLRFNEAGVAHIHAELDQAIALCEAAQAAGSERNAERLLADASSSYHRAQKLMPRVRLSSQDAHEIKQKCLRLQALLGEVGVLASAYDA